jgi:hypothetical protein
MLITVPPDAKATMEVAGSSNESKARMQRLCRDVMMDDGFKRKERQGKWDEKWKELVLWIELLCLWLSSFSIYL